VSGTTIFLLFFVELSLSLNYSALKGVSDLFDKLFGEKTGPVDGVLKPGLGNSISF
jgi:hypothetical protein